MTRVDERTFRLFVLFYFACLALLSATTPLSPSEAKLFYEPRFIPSAWVARELHEWIPGMAGLRIFPYLLGVFNAGLFWQILREYFPRREDRRFAFLIYLMLPGVIASAVLLNTAVYALSCVLLFLWAYLKGRFWLQLSALAALVPSPTATFAFYAALALYGYRKREYRLAASALLFLIVVLALGTYGFSGRPRGHFLELLGVDAALFSPLFFIYYFYSLYRVSLEGPRDIFWYVSATALVVSLVLSIRQQILIVDFGPYLLAGAMIPVAVYLRSLRVRMRRFQRRYRLAAGAVVATLLLSALVLFLHRPIYRLLGSPTHYFAAAIYEPYDQMIRLRSEGKKCYPRLRKRRYEAVMRFYGLQPCRKGK